MAQNFFYELLTLLTPFPSHTEGPSTFTKIVITLLQVLYFHVGVGQQINNILMLQQKLITYAVHA